MALFKNCHCRLSCLLFVFEPIKIKRKKGITFQLFYFINVAYFGYALLQGFKRLKMVYIFSASEINSGWANVEKILWR